MGGKATSARITVYLPPDKAKEFEQWAYTEHRSVSNLAAAVLLNALEARAKSNTKDRDDAA